MRVVTTSTSEDYLELLDVEAPNPFHSRNLHGIPGQIVNLAGLGVDEVMVAR